MRGLIVTRRHFQGDHVYCRSCGGEASADRHGGKLSIAPPGRRGSKRNPEPEVDNSLMAELVKESSRHLVLAA